MHISLKKIYISSLLALLPFISNAAGLTPIHEPHDNSFYVCYQKCQIQYKLHAPLATFKKYHYIGCTIQSTPCHCPCTQEERCQSYRPKLKLFDWFDNYPQALNAFYRCAYS